MTSKTVTEQTEDLLALKEEAKNLKIRFHPNIGLEALQKRVKEKQIELAGQQEAPAQISGEEPTPPAKPEFKRGKQLTPEEIKEMKRKESLELVRVRVTCMNPNKKDWEGEIFTVANSVVPTQKKYVPFNITEGWHIPRIMLNMIQEREYQTFVTERDHRGRAIRRGTLKKEFNVEVLPPLTAEEISELKKKQALRAGKVD